MEEAYEVPNESTPSYFIVKLQNVKDEEILNATGREITYER